MQLNNENILKLSYNYLVLKLLYNYFSLRYTFMLKLHRIISNNMKGHMHSVYIIRTALFM